MYIRSIICPIHFLIYSWIFPSIDRIQTAVYSILITAVLFYEMLYFLENACIYILHRMKRSVNCGLVVVRMHKSHQHTAQVSYGSFYENACIIFAVCSYFTAHGQIVKFTDVVSLKSCERGFRLCLVSTYVYFESPSTFSI